VSNSSFLNDCSACQQCITSFQNEQGAKFQGQIFQVVLVNVLNLCSNSTAADQVAALQAQASKLSALGSTRTLSGSSSATSMPTTAISPITTAPIAAGIPHPNPDGGIVNINRIVVPTVGSVLGLVAILAVTYFLWRKHRRRATVASLETKAVDSGSESGDSRGGTPLPPPEVIEPKELETVEIYELPASEPVGFELHTPRDGKMDEEDWPLPMGPLRAMFVETEMRDERMGDESAKHHTFYNP